MEYVSIIYKAGKLELIGLKSRLVKATPKDTYKIHG